MPLESVITDFLDSSRCCNENCYKPIPGLVSFLCTLANLQNFQEWYLKPFWIKLSVSLPTPAFQTQELKFGLARLLIVVAPAASILTLAINSNHHETLINKHLEEKIRGSNKQILTCNSDFKLASSFSKVRI
jgi:hypothetical protein